MLQKNRPLFYHFFPNEKLNRSPHVKKKKIQFKATQEIKPPLWSECSQLMEARDQSQVASHCSEEDTETVQQHVVPLQWQKWPLYRGAGHALIFSGQCSVRVGQRSGQHEQKSKH